MNDRFYRLSAASLRVMLGVNVLARPFDLFSRVWLRHRKVYTHLRASKFDGVIDAGANAGEFSQLARAALPQADLVCIEPHPVSAEALRQQGFRVVEAALWSEPGKIELRQPEAASTSCTVMPGASARDSWQVTAVRLESVPVSGDHLLIKLDLQGAEFAALQGMGQLWERCAGLLVEVSMGPAGTYEKMRQLLAEREYYEYSTTNELIVNGKVVEADKLWLRSSSGVAARA